MLRPFPRQATRIVAWAALVLTLSVIAGCSGKGNEPRALSELIKTIYQSDCKSLYAYTGSGSEPALLYSAPGDWEIISFDYSSERFVNFMILSRYDTALQMSQTSLAQVLPDGWATELYGASSCTECEGASGLWDLHVSPDGRYLALDVYYYEGSGVALFDVSARQMVSFEHQFGYEYAQFVAWHPSRNAFFVEAGHTYLEYDIGTRTVHQLESPNIRDYISGEELLAQGYLGGRVDYMELVGMSWFKYINWHSCGWHFVYESNDSLFQFNMSDSTEVLLHVGSYSCYANHHYGIEWAEQDGGIEPPDFGNRDIIAVFDSTLLDSIAPLNDSISFEVGKRQSLSFLECLWGQDEFGTQYYFRSEVTAEKCHIAEMDHLFGVFAFNLTPAFWYLITDYAFGHSLTDAGFASRYRQMAESYALATEAFRAYHYPSELAGKQTQYNELVMQDSRFESATAEYLKTRDADSFIDTLSLLAPDIPLSVLDTIATWLGEFQSGSRSKFAFAHQLLHNRYFNYYGRVIVPDLERAMRENLIEPFYWEAIPVDGSKSGHPTSEAYLTRKIYEF